MPFLVLRQSLTFRQVDPNDVGRAHVDRPFSTIKRLSGRKDEIRSRINLYVGDIDAALGGGNMHFTGWLRPKRTWRHPHLGSIGIIVVNEATNDDAPVGDIVNMRR